MRYADPTLCPDCRSALPRGVPTCPTCQLLVRHPLAIRLFGTLQTADTLLVQLRSASDEFHAVGARQSVPAGAAQGATPPPPPPPPASALPGPHRAPVAPVAPVALGGGVGFASVPKILLGLGALCLLVAALVFLAVSWSALGVGGRTAVLAGFTLAAGASALILHRAGLRVAGESLIVVALGMLGLDVLGAGAAGWLGDGPDGVVTLTTGLVLSAAGAALGLVRVGDRPRLVAPQIISGIGLLTAYLGAMDTTDHRLLAGHALTVLGIGVVLLARSISLPALMWSHLVGVALVWTATAGIALTDAILEPTLDQLWLRGSGWSLLATAALMLLPGVVVRERTMLLAGASCAATILTVTATLPSIDTDAATFGLVALGVSAAWVLVFGALPTGVRAIAIAPSIVGTVILFGLALVAGGVAFARWVEIESAFGSPLDVGLRRPDPVTEPLLLVPSLVVIVVFLALLSPDRGRGALRVWAQALTLTAGVGAAVTLASYDVLLAVPVTALTLTALAAAAFALTARGARAAGFGAAALVLAALASILAVPSSTLTLVVAGVGFLVALGFAAVARDRVLKVLGGLTTAPALALAIGAGVDVAAAGAAWVAIPILAGVGVVALCLPRLEVELSAIGTALVAFPVSLATAADAGGLAAFWLTVAGCLACASALLHESRRSVAWAGGVLLLLASWVRLADLDVSDPEPYTLPLAALLLAFGLWRMRKDDAVGTAEALLPGLTLATVPSLIWVLQDPVSIRALVLGTGCLVLSIAGAALRWSAPLLTGATVGAVVVVREIGAYPGEIPRWVWIALAGMLLIVAGITWERRLLELRNAAGFLGRLR
ncbi:MULTISPECIES: SCO7613 C-terminal domain-containing membrane protein [Nocardioides]|uniref:SCO7613 C-terminal domain-containing membrane protein n=1 Tax=Nocardioides vastitatis TaxID=2568655 RepID=A0ABW0ZAH7_9ACTN|nr:hypothetical protein [Nocardioides sp.]THJ08855.1 hypothetical protein E7Z54_03685 [Nocardioides sp.]